MSILADIALILFVLVGYSIGRTCFAAKYKIYPSIIDLSLNFILWLGAFLISVPIEKGWRILLWFTTAALVGLVLTLLLPKIEDKPKYKTLFAEEEPNPLGPWRRWKKLSTKMGDFQSRLILMWLYFVLVLPFGTLVRLISDPLGLKPPVGTGWLPRPDVNAELDGTRRQF